ncbi:MAG: MoxR family ATPase [Magnetococcales bacterium]|nr:MoxR family ATPase [Magnetococcales bacterium]NGZ28400.1 MoxR family ATPase [Magnetococcales bacterium]
MATFEILSPANRSDRQRQLLETRDIPPSLGSHKEAAKYYIPNRELVDAINVALTVGAPLLLTGEPGTGKTQVAHYLAWYFGIQLYPLFVRSTTTAEDLLYRFDAIAYLQAAQDPQRQGKGILKQEFIQKGPLWLAYDDKRASVVLLDEIDKAPRDFPNDLLNILDQHTFTVGETGEVVGRGERPPPVVVITSNSERRLPEPFLRRCIFHHIEFNEELIRQAVAARVGDFPNLDPQVQDIAIQRFLELRSRDIRKKPATAELLVWLAILSASGQANARRLRDASLDQLPFLNALIKDRGDVQTLR